MRYVLHIQYDGTDFCGWQIQPNVATVQGHLAEVLSEYGFTNLPTAAGRTDTGVHAREMTVHADCPTEFKIPLRKASEVLTRRLPEGIAVLNIFPAPSNDFHARYSAKAREYTYRIITERDVFKQRFSSFYASKLDLGLLEKAASLIRGKHDFTTFSKHNPDTKNPICNIEIADWQKKSDDEFLFRVKADRFIYGMVRSLAGSMIDVAAGKRTLADFHDAFKARDRNRNSRIAPAAGLIFEKAYYPEFQ